MRNSSTARALIGVALSTIVLSVAASVEALEPRKPSELLTLEVLMSTTNLCTGQPNERELLTVVGQSIDQVAPGKVFVVTSFQWEGVASVPDGSQVSVVLYRCAPGNRPATVARSVATVSNGRAGASEVLPTGMDIRGDTLNSEHLSIFSTTGVTPTDVVVQGFLAKDK